MLNRKNLMILAGILVVLIVISIAQHARHDRTTSRASTETLLPGEFARADLARITVGFGAEPEAVVLETAPDHWRVASAWNAVASDQRIDALLRGLSNLRGEFRSDSPDVVADYGFTDSTVITVTGLDEAGDTVFALEVGNKPARGQGNFVRRPGASEVYLCGTSVLNSLGLWNDPERPQSRHFIELQAFRLERQQVDAIELAGDSSLTLTKQFEMVEPAESDTVHTEAYPDRSQWEWRLDGGEAAMKTKADAVLGAVCSVRAQDVVDPAAGPAAYGLDQPARRVVITLADGTETTLSFGDEREAEGSAPGGSYARLGNDPTVWVIGEYNVDNIFKTRDELLPE